MKQWLLVKWFFLVTVTQASAKSNFQNKSTVANAQLNFQNKSIVANTQLNFQNKSMHGNNTGIPGNIVKNGRFTKYELNSGLLTFWTCNGGDVYLTKPLPMYHHWVNKTVHVGYCRDRKKKNHGPNQEISHRVAAGTSYKIRAQTQLDKPGLLGMSVLASIELWLLWVESGKSKPTKKLLARREKYANNTGWVLWDTQFFLPDQIKYDSVQIYFKGPSIGVGIFAKDVYLTKLYQQPNWKKDAYKRIEALRTREVTVRLTFNGAYNQSLWNSTLKVEQVNHSFGFGTAANFYQLAYVDGYRNFIKDNFDWVTIESALKWTAMESKEGEISHDNVNKMLAILTKMNKKLRGHCIFWEIDQEIPKWLNNQTGIELIQSMRDRLEDVINSYKGKFVHWDVDNEMLHGSFFSDHTSVKSTIRRWMFEQARLLDTTGKLFLNEFDVVDNGVLTRAYLELAKEFKSLGVPVDGIGVQGHFTGQVHPVIVKDRLDTLAEAGLPIWFTELDILEENVTKRADSLENILVTAFSHPSVEGVVLWSFWDQQAWRGRHTSLVDGDEFKLNEAGSRFMKLRKQWTTSPKLKSPSVTFNDGCVFKFQAFHGVHNLRIHLPDGMEIEKKNVDVSKSDKHLLIELNAQAFPLDDKKRRSNIRKPKRRKRHRSHSKSYSLGHQNL